MTLYVPCLDGVQQITVSSDGKISLGLNPDGPVDRQVGLIRVERPDGSLIGLAANYAMHGTVMNGTNTLISGDGPGVVTDIFPP